MLTNLLAEVLVTGAIIIVLYVVWQVWLSDNVYAAQAGAESQSLAQQWERDYADSGPLPTEQPAVTAEPPVLPQPADGEDFAIMRIPRLGSDYAFTMAGGVTRPGTLDKKKIGHYPDTAMPGQPGNFAVAAHRTTYGAPFNRIAGLHVGDAIVIETPDGWYTYRFRTLEYVTPDEVKVLLPVPQAMDMPAGTPYITMTSCSPMYSLAERIVAYGVFESFTPRAAGEPASLRPVA